MGKIEKYLNSFANLKIGEEKSPLVSDFILCVCCEYLISYKGYHSGNDFYKVIRQRFTTRTCLPHYLFGKLQHSGDLDDFLSFFPSFDVNGVFESKEKLEGFLATSKWSFDGENNVFSFGGKEFSWKSIFLRPIFDQDGNAFACEYFSNDGKPIWESIGFLSPMGEASLFSFDEEKALIKKQNSVLVMDKKDFFLSCKDLKETDDDQREAISSSLDKHLLVLAGAGSGKTRCLVSRVAYLNLVLGIPLNRMVLLTFTRNVASELHSKVTDLINNSIDYSKINPGVDPSVQTQTIDAFFVSTIRNFYDDIGFTKKPDLGSNFNDLEKKRSIVDDIIRKNGLLPMFSNDAEYALRSPSAKEKLPTDFLIKELDSIICGLTDSASGKYQVLESYYMAWQKANCELLDFSSVTYFVREALLSKNGTLKSKMINKYRCILIDEFQDISILQNSAFEPLYKDSPINFTFVGDDDQTIYGWRGSDNRIIDDMSKSSTVKTVSLSTNYRSDPSIVEAGNAILTVVRGRAKTVKMRTRGETSGKITLATYNDKYEELVAEVLRLLRAGTKAEDILVLSRSNPFRDDKAEGTPSLFSTLKASAIPVSQPSSEIQLTGNYYLFKAIASLICGLPVVAPTNTIRAMTGAPYQITDKKIQDTVMGKAEAPAALQEVRDLSFNIRESGEFCSKFCDIIERYGYAAREISGSAHGPLDDPIFEALRESALNFDLDWKPASSSLNSFFDTFEKEANKPEKNTTIKKDLLHGVQLNSIHAAKGLEADVVFIVGCENRAGTSLNAKAIQRRIEEAQNAQGNYEKLLGTMTETEFDAAIAECDTAGFDKTEKDVLAQLKDEILPYKRALLTLQAMATQNYIDSYRKAVARLEARLEKASLQAKAEYTAARNEFDGLSDQKAIAESAQSSLSEEQESAIEKAKETMSKAGDIVNSLASRSAAFTAGTSALRTLFEKCNRASGISVDLFNESNIEELQNELDNEIAKEANEERRVFYVGVTRAKKKLYLMYNQNKKPSDYIDLIPPQLIERKRITTIGEQKEIDDQIKGINKRASDDPEGGKTSEKDVELDLSNPDLCKDLDAFVDGFDHTHPLCRKLNGKARNFLVSALKLDCFNKISNVQETIISICLCLERSAVDLLSSVIVDKSSRFYSDNPAEIHKIAMDLTLVETSATIPGEAYVRDLLTQNKKMRGCDPMETVKGLAVEYFIVQSGYDFVSEKVKNSWPRPSSCGTLQDFDTFISSCLALADCRNLVAHPDDSEFWSNVLTTAYKNYYRILESVF